MLRRKVWKSVGWKAIPFAAWRLGVRDLFPCDRDEVKVVREQRGQRVRGNLARGLAIRKTEPAGVPSLREARISPKRERVACVGYSMGDPLAGASGWYHVTA